jgi:hypothetical protein
VFARALVKLSTFDDRASFSTWLHGIAINTVRNHWRSCRSTADAHRRLEAIHAVRGSTDDRMDQVQLCRERARLVYTILETLPDHLREAFVLRDLEGLSPGEAARSSGSRPATSRCVRHERANAFARSSRRSACSRHGRLAHDRPGDSPRSELDALLGDVVIGVDAEIDAELPPPDLVAVLTMARELDATAVPDGWIEEAAQLAPVIPLRDGRKLRRAHDDAPMDAVVADIRGAMDHEIGVELARRASPGSSEPTRPPPRIQLVGRPPAGGPSGWPPPRCWSSGAPRS